MSALLTYHLGDVPLSTTARVMGGEQGQGKLGHQVVLVLHLRQFKEELGRTELLDCVLYLLLYFHPGDLVQKVGDLIPLDNVGGTS